MRKKRTVKPKVGSGDLIAVSVNDASTLSGLGKNSLYDLMNDGTLPSFLICGRRLIRVKDLEKLFEQPK